jgi:hypothetical protein
MAFDVLSSFAGNFKLDWAVAKTRTPFQPTTNNDGLVAGVAYTLGVGTNQINQLSSTIVDVPAGAPGSFEVDLTGGGLVNVLTEPAVTFSNVRLLFVKLLTPLDKDTAGLPIGNPNTGVVVMGGATAPWPFLKSPSGTIELESGDFHLQVRRTAGLPVTLTTADRLKFTNSDAVNVAKVLLVLAGTGS